MGFRRRCFGCRCKSSFVIIIIGLCIAGFVISYQMLKELSSSRSSRAKSLYPQLDSRIPFHYPALKHRNILPDSNIHRGAAVGRDLNSKVTELRGNFAAHSIKEVKDFLDSLEPEDWSTASQPDEVAIELKHLLLDLDLDSRMTCKEIDSLRLGLTLAQSSKKFIERGQTEDNHRMEYTVVSQSLDLQTKVACMKKIYDPEHCAPMGNYKLLKQLLLMCVLRHPSILDLRGYCVRGDGVSSEIRKKGIILVSDVGVAFHQGGFSVIPWKKKITFAMEMIDLLDYLESNPLGSIGLGKISTQDFVLYDREESMRLVDLDGITIHEKSCSSSSDCVLAGVDYGIKCEDGQCKGFNALSNLQNMTVSVLDPLLRHGPGEYRSEAESILDRARALKISKSNIKETLQKLLSESGDEPAVNSFNNGYRNTKHKNEDNRMWNNRYDNNNEEEEEEDRNNDNHANSNNIGSIFNKYKNVDPVNSFKVDGEYVRYDLSNYPGMHDYLCSGSRVSWGCVLTTKGLQDAKNKCDTDMRCKSFVVFSTQPEADSLMTVVFKNSANGSPQSNPGTTLFIKKSHFYQGNDRENVVKMAVDEDMSGKVKKTEKNVGEISANAVVDQPVSPKYNSEMCLKKIFKAHEETRKSREKRLMAHFGMKGMREMEWQRSLKRQSAGSFSNLITAKNTETKGGKFLISLKADDLNEIVSKAIFTAEDGPSQYHVSQAIIYYLDRLLGLYHTPPSVVGTLPSSTVRKYQKTKSWKEAFSSLTDEGKGLKGIFSAPVPHVMKQDKLMLKPLKSMVSKITKFSRQSKLQFEYVLLWWLGKITKDPTDHIGYKGHFIHFNGDEAFTSSNTFLTGYFNHCQFPNIVYKTLNCLRCHNSLGTQLSSVCNLGQEVMKKVQVDKFSLSNLQVQDLNESDIITQINDAASIAVSMVEVCIKLFGREQVLY